MERITADSHENSDEFGELIEEFPINFFDTINDCINLISGFFGIALFAVLGTAMCMFYTQSEGDIGHLIVLIAYLLAFVSFAVFFVYYSIFYSRKNRKFAGYMSMGFSYSSGMEVPCSCAGM